MKETMTVEQAAYHKLFLQNGLTEHFDRDVDKRLERENPLSDITLALSTCGGKREEQIHILNEYILNTTPEQIDKDAVFSFVADELRERFEQNPDPDLEAFTILMHDIARDSGWWREFEPWATMYLMNDLYDEAWHGVFSGVRELIYRDHGADKELSEALLPYMLHEGYCSWCRLCLLELMQPRGLLTPELIEECRWDCYMEIREFVDKL